MPSPRLLLLALLVFVFVAQVAAQSRATNSAASEPRLDGLVAPPEFRAHVPPLPPIARERMRDVRPSAAADRELLSDSDTECLYLRTYQVKREDRHSDTTRFSGYSECQPAARFRTKSAVEPQLIIR